MSKRFIDDKLFRKDFVRSLDTPYKLLWIYILLDCDHAGIWLKDFEVVNIRLKIEFDENKVKKIFNEKIVEIDEEKWFIPSFLEFQYGQLRLINKVHASVINILRKYNLINKEGFVKGLTNPIDEAKEKEKDKDKYKEKDKIYYRSGQLEKIDKIYRKC